MVIPDFQSVMLPIMNYLTSAEVRSNADVTNQISDEFELTPEQRLSCCRLVNKLLLKTVLAGRSLILKRQAGLNRLNGHIFKLAI